MRIPIHDLWGCARGPVTRATPQTRLLAGAATFAASMVFPAATVSGALGAVGTLAAWLAACRLPFKVGCATFILGLALLLPYVLLLPLLADAPSVGGQRFSLIVPWTILLRGLCAMLVCTATVAALSLSDLHEGLIRLPLPNMVSAILLQIVHQTATLSDETRRVASAMALRGAAAGVCTSWRVLLSLPQVWLVRMIVRAERVSVAMKLRGYSDGRLHSLREVKLQAFDFVVLGLAAAVLTTAIALRVLGAA